jgi:hypothetical protein
MIYTNTASEYRDGTPAAILPGAAGLDRRAADYGAQRLAAERAMDDVLANSFPASDPPSWNPGVTRPESIASVQHRAPRSKGADASDADARADDIGVSRPRGSRAVINALISFAGAVGIALLVPFAVLLVGMPVALVVRGLLEATGWLFGIDVR